MRILNDIEATNPAHGGPMEWVRQYGVAVKSMGHQVDIVSMDSPEASWIESYPLKIYALGSQLKGFYCPSLVSWLKKHASDYDHIIVHGLWRYPSFGTWRALQKLRKPYYVYTHGMLGSWFKKKYPLKHFGKWLYWPWTDYKVLRDARAVIYTCDQEREHASQSFWLYRANEVVIPLGLAAPELDMDKGKLLFYERFPELNKKQIILFLGRIHEVKGCDLLVQAFSKLAHKYPDAHLVFAGPDPENLEKSLVKLAENSDISSRITWTGMLAGDMKWAALYAADVLALPSHHENFSFTVAEAMACSTPVLISDQVGIWHEVSNYDAGYIASATLAGTEENLQAWLQLTTERKEQLGKNANRCFIEKFEIEHAARHLIKTING